MAAFDPHRQGYRCRNFTGCDGHWFRLGDALVCQCRYCRRVIAVTTQAVPPAGLNARAMDALQSTDGRPADGWHGCID